jgi:hypothetical protein
VPDFFLYSSISFSALVFVVTDVGSFYGYLGFASYFKTTSKYQCQ